MPKVEINSARCKGCLLCVSVCPKHLLEPADAISEFGVQPVEVVGDPAECIGCMSCVLMCPDAAIEIIEVKAAEPVIGKVGS